MSQPINEKKENLMSKTSSVMTLKTRSLMIFLELNTQMSGEGITGGQSPSLK